MLCPLTNSFLVQDPHRGPRIGRLFLEPGLFLKLLSETFSLVTPGKDLAVKPRLRLVGSAATY